MPSATPGPQDWKRGRLVERNSEDLLMASP
jgi:hypothetical protein